MRIFLALLLLIGGLLAALGAFSQAREQVQANTQWVATPAWIDDTDVIMHRGSKGSRYYTPTVSYHYTVNGQAYKSDRVLAISADGDLDWANDIVDRYKDKKTFVELPNDKPPAIAYVNPENPRDAILERQYSFSPYLLTMLSLLSALIGLAMLTRFFSAARAEMLAIAVDETDARLLVPTVNLKSRFKSAFWMFLAISVMALPPLLHWWLVAGQIAGNWGSWISTVIAGGIWLWLLITMLRRWNVSRHISDARLTVKPAPMVRGQPFALALESDALAALRVKQAECRVVCIEHYSERRGNKTYVVARTKVERKAVLCGAMEVPAEQVLAGRGEVAFDEASPPSSSAAQRKVHPWYSWEARVNIELIGAVDYEGVFPLEVV